MDTLLAEIDTISDFVAYLYRREQVVAGLANTQFREFDLLMLYLLERSNGQWGLLLAASAAPSAIPEGLWGDPYCIQCRDRSHAENRKSYIIDRLIEHFHAEYVSGRMLQQENFPFAAHEKALRIIARESRFGRRIIANEIVDIINEDDQSTFWTSTVESSEFTGVRYVWLAYPQPNDGVDDDTFSRTVLNHLKDHIYVARSMFTSALLIGFAFPNCSAAETSHFLVVFDGMNWTEDAQRGAEILQKETGILRNAQPTTRRHVR